MKPHEYYVANEISMIPGSYTIIYPRTMMIINHYACLTHFAMSRSSWLYNYAIETNICTIVGF